MAERLYNIGVKYIDISGAGGTNFIEIEDRRNDEMDFRICILGVYLLHYL